MKKLSPNAVLVYEYVKAHENDSDPAGVTAPEIEKGTGVPVRSVNPIVTRAFCMNKDDDKNLIPLMERIPAEIELEDGTHKAIKLIRLTEAGRQLEYEEA